MVLPRAAEQDRLWLALLVLLTIALHLLVPLPSDVAWLTTVAERLLDGQHLYSDILETNPPMAAWLYLAPALLGRWTGISPEIWVIFEAILAALLALGLTDKMLRPVWTASGEPMRLAIVAAVLVLPVSSFAQREHFELFALLPALGAATLRYSELKPPFWAAAAAGVGAAIALAIKPHAGLVILIIIALEMWRSKSWRPLFAAEHLIALLLAIAYGVIIAVAYPAFFSTMLPSAAAVYVPYRIDVLTLIAQPHVIVVLALSVATILLCRNTLARPPMPILLAATAGSMIVYLAQGKGWPYHLLPGTIIATIMLAVGLLGRTDEPPRARRLAVLALALLIALPAVTGAVRPFVEPDPLYAAVGKFGPGQKIAAIASDLAIANPLSRRLGDIFVNSGPSLWRAMGAIALSVDTDPARRKVLRSYESADRERLALDLIKERPDLILAQDQTGVFDWLAWAKQDPVISGFLDGYAPEKTVPWGASTITVLRRRPKVPPA